MVRGVALLATLLASSPGVAADPATAEASRSGAASWFDDIGLYESTIDPDGLQRGEGGLEDVRVPSDRTADPDDEADDPRRGEPFVAPIPFRSPSLGWGGALAGGYIFRIDPEDTDSPPSTVSAAGFGTENESYGGLLLFKGHLARDRWRLAATAGRARINYDFFGIGSGAGAEGQSIEIESDVRTVFFEAIRQLPATFKLLDAPLYLGPNMRFVDTDNSLRGASLPPGVSASELDETRVALGLHLQRDTRDDTFYPTDGSLVDLTASFFEGGYGSDFDYRAYEASFRRYHEPWDRGVVAWRAFGRFKEGDIPFTDLSAHDLRGYEAGRYRDKMHLAAELEVRQHLFWRFGAAAFAGLGQIAPALDEFESDNLLWSAGFGLRFRLTEENAMNYRTDLAWGRDGFEFYFSITEAF